MGLAHLFLHVTGVDNVSGKWYAFWSGFGSDLGELTILGMFYKRINCHQSGCFRIGLHKLTNSPYTYCHKHLLESQKEK